uniref:Uncharacterized protein n=1 Tax=Anguilla anguilla TaxID=7936 RepID=A0A0E9W350_ANGAN
MLLTFTTRPPPNPPSPTLNTFLSPSRLVLTAKPPH